MDNALRKDGKLVVTDNHTEICQYAAFYFDIATPDTHPALWRKLHTDFGPQRPQTKAFPEVHPANAFIGNYLPGYKSGGIQRVTINTVDHLCDEFEFRIVTRDRDLGVEQPYPDIDYKRL